MLALSDNGCGMDEQTKARIFEPFFTTKEPGKGTGLGLAMIHGFIKQSGGHISVYSEPGIGSTFKIYLPEVEAMRPLGKSHPGIEKMPHGDETILLAEDEAGVRALTRHVLQSCGYTVLEAAHGVEATRLAEKHQGSIHLLITDVVMPGMGGRLLAERVVGLKPGIKVLYLSGYTNDAVVRHGVLESEVAFLQKPFKPSALVVKVREVLDKPGAPGASPTTAGKSKTTILVIDDDEQIRDLLRTMLEGEGYAVVWADNGAKGVREYRQRPTDLVLCDIFMDRQEGLETIRQLHEEFPQAKIIAISGGSPTVIGDFLYYAKKLGAVATLQKPLEQKSLLQIVRKVLQT
jgi:CheY-like chemotaxis protein